MKNLRIFAALACAIFAGTTSASAATYSYNFTWTGNAASQLSMTGSFSGTDANIDGFLRDTEISALSFEGFLNGVSQGTQSLAHTMAGFNFNFDLNNDIFLNGHSVSGDGQWWNSMSSGLGFVDGSAAARLTLNSIALGSFTDDPQAYTANAVPSAVPLPAALPLYGAGLAFMGFIGWRRKRKTEATA